MTSSDRRSIVDRLADRQDQAAVLADRQHLAVRQRLRGVGLPVPSR